MHHARRSQNTLYGLSTIFFYDGYFYISDTDSLAFGLCKEFEYIIKNGKENQWREAEERWFCKVGYSMISYIC